MTPATEPLPSTLIRSPRRRWSAVSVVGLLLAACCFWQGLPALSSLWQDDAQAHVAVPVFQRQLVRTKIKDLRPGQRVIAGNPELGEALADSDIDPATWRLITLAMSKPDGGRLDIELLRPVEWIEHVSADVGRTVELDLAELGAAGPAEVLSIAPCPEIEPDDGTGRRVVTGTFRHSSGHIYDIQIAGEPAPIGTTGNHPFWSEDRHAFVPAETLQPSEHLRQANGSTTTVVSLTRRPNTEPVYNLEVDVDHVYHVGIGGVLVHNSCAGFNPKMREALDWLNERGFDSTKAIPFASRSSKTFMNGRLNGMRHGSIGYRIEFDARNKAHINVFSGKELGPHFTFSQDSADMAAILRQLFGG